MTLRELYELVNRFYNPEVDFMERDTNVVVAIKLPYSTVGALPTVPIKSASMGFDWDSGKFMFYTEQPLTLFNEDFSKKMHKMQEDLGMCQYENRNLKNEIKRLRKMLENKA